MIDLLKRTTHIPEKQIVMVRRVEGVTIRDDGTQVEWVWYPAEDQYMRWLAGTYTVY